MAKAKTPVKAKKTKKIEHLHINLTNKNYMIIGLGILVIIIGYVFMNENSVDGFLPSVVAPILLVIGYLVIVPFGILFSDKSANAETVENPSATTNVTTN
jgi:NAD/NADP transhydrogenase beta subunit